MLLNWIDKYLSFLESEHSFVKMPDYNYVREIHTDFIKGNLVLNIAWDGGYFIRLFKVPDNLVDDIYAGKIKPAKIDLFTRKNYNLEKLDPGKRIYNSISGDNFPEKEIWYVATLLKKNPEILDGDMSSFRFSNRLLDKLRKKNSR